MEYGIEEAVPGVWVVSGDTHIAGWVREHGSLVCDPWLFDVINPILSDPACSTVWDIGANIGDHTAYYLSLGKTVVAVEPHPEAFHCLELNCGGHPKATLLNLAASSTEGSVRFSRLANTGASRVCLEDGDVKVRQGRLDLVSGLPFPDFVKLDVEGYEPDALRGMLGVLSFARPVAMVEINRHALGLFGYTPDDITRVFVSLDYAEPFILQPGVSWDDPQFDVIFKPNKTT